MRIIKKYANRKLYDTKKHKYISLTDIISMINDNTLFKVENPNKYDITKEILAQCVVRNARDYTESELMEFIGGK